MRKVTTSISFAALIAFSCTKSPSELRLTPADDIQQAIDRAATSNPKPKVILTAGTYRPRKIGQALLHLNAKHDGLEITGEGEVILTAANETIAEKGSYSYPSVVNHVLYLGHGLTGSTKISNLVITGANGFVTKEGEFEAEPERSLKRRFIFYGDGGGIKVFGASSPVLENLIIRDNKALQCGGGISIEQMGLTPHPVKIKDVVLQNNVVPLTGAAIDLLPGSHAIVEDSRIEGNVANEIWVPESTISEVRKRLKWKRKINWSLYERSSAITVFAGSTLKLTGSRVQGNSAGLDYNPEFKWYWGAISQVIPDRPWELENNNFRENRLYDISGPKSGKK